MSQDTIWYLPWDVLLSSWHGVGTPLTTARLPQKVGILPGAAPVTFTELSQRVQTFVHLISGYQASFKPWEQRKEIAGHSACTREFTMSLYAG